MIDGLRRSGRREHLVLPDTVGLSGLRPADLTPDGDTRVEGRDDAWLCSAAMTDLTSDRFPTDRVAALTASWELALRAERKRPATITVYRDGVQRYLTWCTAQGAEPMDRTSLNAWVACLLDAGAAPGTARTRQLAVRRFAAGHLAADPFLGVRAPKLDQPVVDPLTDHELRALIQTCIAPDCSRLEAPLHHRRDEAIIRLAHARDRHPGRRSRRPPDRRRRPGRRPGHHPPGQGWHRQNHSDRASRHPGAEPVPRPAATHRLAESPDLWLGSQGKRFGYDGLGRALRRRAKRAGIEGFHPHKLRHTAAHRWLAKGGSESGLMAIAGWTRTDMLVRYTRARASERAAEQAWRLNLGEL